jgi:hypothetical protein
VYTKTGIARQQQAINTLAQALQPPVQRAS